MTDTADALKHGYWTINQRLAEAQHALAELGADNALDPDDVIAVQSILATVHDAAFDMLYDARPAGADDADYWDNHYSDGTRIHTAATVSVFGGMPAGYLLDDGAAALFPDNAIHYVAPAPASEARR